MQALSKNDRTWAMLAHLSAIVGYVMLPFLGNVIAPLVLWLVMRDRSQFIDDQAKESLNFQITLTIYAIVSSVLVTILILAALLVIIYVTGLTISSIVIIVLIALIFPVIVYAAGVFLTVVAAIKANNGESYRYPLTIRLVH